MDNRRYDDQYGSRNDYRQDARDERPARGSQSVIALSRQETSSSRTLLVTNLPPHMSENDLYIMMAKLGPVEDVFLKPGRGQATVVYRNPDDALKAKRQYHRTMVQGSMISVSF